VKSGDSIALPSGWCSTSLGELLDRLQYGYTASASSTASGPRFLRITDLQEFGVDWSSVPGCEASVTDIQKYLLADGDFVFARSGSIEKAWRVRNPPEAVFASYLIRGRPLAPETAAWLEQFIRSSSYLEQIGAAGAGIGMQNVNATKLAAVVLPLPPAAEQSRIVTKVEVLTVRSRQARAALDAVPPLLEQFRQSILAAAFRGDLTADWRAKNPNVEPADKLIARIRAERRSAWETSLRTKGKDPRKARYEEPTRVDTRDLPTLPGGWVWTTVEDVTSFVTDGTHQPPPTTSSGIPFVGIRNILDGRIDWTSVDRWVSAETHQALTSRFRASTGDTLYATVGATFGQAVLVEDERAFVFQRHIAHLRAVPSISPNYLTACLSSPLCFEQAKAKARGAAQPTVNLSDLRAFVIPLPPVAEQETVVSRVSHAGRSIEGIAARLRGATERSIKLEQAVLAKAFKGELVPQDPSDEPASVLLDRIRAARGALGPAGQAARRRSRKADVIPDSPELDDTMDADGFGAAGRSASVRDAGFDFADVHAEALHREVFAALWAHGPLDKGDAVRRVAEHLREAGQIEFQRLRSDGPLYGQVFQVIEAAVKSGYLDRPKRGQVRACKTDAAAYRSDDWRQALLASLGAKPVDREHAIRVAAEWARDNLGLEFARLRSDGQIVEGLRSAINSAIRRGEIIRHDASRISRAAGNGPVPKPLDRDSGARPRGPRGTSEVRDV
jgi:type I restriction enzyme, S subunit